MMLNDSLNYHDIHEFVDLIVLIYLVLSNNDFIVHELFWYTASCIDCSAYWVEWHSGGRLPLFSRYVLLEPKTESIISQSVMFIHSLNPNQHYKTEATQTLLWSLLQGPWTSSQPSFWWFSAVKRRCRERDSGLKFELGAGAKSTVSWAPLAMTERPSDSTRLVTGQNSEFFFMLSKSTLDISKCALSYSLWGNGSGPIQFNFGFLVAIVLSSWPAMMRKALAAVQQLIMKLQPMP